MQLKEQKDENDENQSLLDGLRKIIKTEVVKVTTIITFLINPLSGSVQGD